jgi:IMP dehydrogenase/GMP reductase
MSYNSLNNKFTCLEKYHDFKDVLILPKSSDLNSRSEVNLITKLEFNNGQTWEGIPIIAANMTTTGTFEVYDVLSKYKIITALHKFYNLNDYLLFKNERFKALNPIDPNYFMVSTGISDSDFKNLKEILQHIECKFILIDVANGYISNLKEYVKKVRQLYPDKIIVAGNISTKEGIRDLAECGVDIIKAGIGGGCFKSDTRILMSNGIYKNIEDILEGEYVINKNGKSVKVLKKINNGIKNFINIKTNNWHTKTYVTPEHNYWIGDLSTSSRKTINSSGKSKLLDQLTKTSPPKSKYKWENIENCFEKKILLMPKNIDWDLPENFCIDLSKYNLRGKIDDDYIYTYNQKEIKIKRFINSNYDLGYIFGTYLGDGNSHITINNKNCESASCHWSFNINENDISNKLVSCIYNVIEYNCSIKKKDNNVLFINCYNKSFTKLLNEFSKKTNKFLPENYYCKNKDYIQGLFDGLIDSDGNIEITNTKKYIYNLTNTSKYILELFYWCCMNLQISYSSNICKKSIGNLKGTCIDNIKDSYRIKTHTMNRYTKDYLYSEVLNYDTSNILIDIGWDIEVDCETHSFIANNSIVHNSACTTRIQTGIGMPQLSCVMECSEEAYSKSAYIISDGGITCPGDVAKAFGGGADFVMIGGEFSGHDENPGDLIKLENGECYKFFYGMSSSYAMKNNYATNNNTHYRSSEGREIRVKYKGKLENTVQNYLGGLRSTCTYTNSANLSELYDNTKFILVNNQYNNNLVNGK